MPRTSPTFSVRIGKGGETRTASSGRSSVSSSGTRSSSRDRSECERSEEGRGDWAAGFQGATADHVLMVTIDFPPRVGGIQILVHRLCRLPANLARPSCVAPANPGADAFDVTLPFPVSACHRSRREAGRASSRVCSGCCARSVLAAWRARPRALLCSHPVVAPIGWAVRRLLGSRTSSTCTRTSSSTWPAGSPCVAGGGRGDRRQSLFARISPYG